MMQEMMEYSTNKKEMYEEAALQLSGLFEDCPYVIANLANASALLNQVMKEINWIGFYLLEKKESTEDFAVKLQDEIKESGRDFLVELQDEIRESDRDFAVKLQDEIRESDRDFAVKLQDEIRESGRDFQKELKAEESQTDRKIVCQQILVLGPFQGKPACVEIEIGKGVCGTAVERDEVMVVKDVHAFPGHIACDGASRSEIVLPIHANGRIVGVLDIDSPILARFDEEDEAGLKQVVRVIESMLSDKI